MDIRINHTDSVLTVFLVGEIDHHNADELREKLDKTYERSGCKHMVFDFSQVTFMDSSGIGLIIGRYRNAEKRGGHVSIAGMNDEIRRIYQISGLAKIVSQLETADAAKEGKPDGCNR